MTVTVNGQTSHSETFSYADPHGRMVSKSLNGVSKAFSYDANHPHAAASLGENSYTYDLNGSQVGRVIGSTAYTLTYDGENRMIRVEPVGGMAANSAPARQAQRKVMALQFAPTQGWDFDTPAPVFTFTPTLTRTPTPTATATLTPLPTGTATPTPEPSPTGTAAPTQEPTQTPDLPPTETPTPTPQPPPLEWAQYFYDGDGTLVKSIVNGEVTYYVSRQFHLRVSGEETRIQKYYPFGGQPIAVRTQANGTDTLTWLLTDHLGSAQVTAAEGGAASGVQHYTAFGEVRSRGGEMPTAYQYTGQLSQMEEVGLYHYGARWFDPYITRFTQPDSVIPNPYNPLFWDRYSYVSNNPLKYVDPSGHMQACADGDAGGGCETESTLDQIERTYADPDHGIGVYGGLFTEYYLQLHQARVATSRHEPFAEVYWEIAAAAKQRALNFVPQDKLDPIMFIDPGTIYNFAQFTVGFGKDAISGGAVIVGAVIASPNQLNKAINRGQAPAGVARIDPPKIPGEQLHVHFDDGSALNVDGTWKHGNGNNLTKAQKEWLEKNGWNIP